MTAFPKDGETEANCQMPYDAPDYWEAKLNDGTVIVSEIETSSECVVKAKAWLNRNLNEGSTATIDFTRTDGNDSFEHFASILEAHKESEADTPVEESDATYIGRVVCIHNDANYVRAPGWVAEHEFKGDDDEQVQMDLINCINTVLYGCVTGEISSLVVQFTEIPKAE